MNKEKKIPMMTVKELLVYSWAMFREKIQTIIFVSLLSLLVSLLVAILLELVDIIFTNLPNLIIIQHSLVLLLLILLVYFAVRINVAVYLVLAKNIRSLKEVWRLANKYFFSFATTMFWLVLVIFIWFIITNDRLVALFTIPVFAVLIFYSMVAWVFFLEDYHGQSALKRTQELMRGYWGAITLRLLFLLIPLLLFVLLVSLIKSVQTASILMSIFDYFYAILVLMYTYQVYDNLIKIKGHSQMEHGKYPTLTHIGTITIYIAMIVGVYVWVVF